VRLLRRKRLHDISLVMAALSAASLNGTSVAIGLVLFALGLGLQVWSKAALRRDKELCTKGPYALCRHPFYFGNALFDLGLCTMSGNWWLVVLYPFAFVVAYLPTIRSERATLIDIFGNCYQDYRRTTAAFFPPSVRVLRDWSVPLSWKCLLSECQVSRTIRYVSFPILILLAGRIWALQGGVLNATNLCLGSGVVALNLLSRVINIRYELGDRKRLRSRCVLLAPRHAIAVCGVLFLVVASDWEIDPEDILVVATMSFLLFGWVLLTSGIESCVQSWQSPARAFLQICSAGLVVFSLYRLEALWLSPLAVVVILSRGLWPAETYFGRAGPRMRLLTGIAASAIALGVVFHTGGSVQVDDLTSVEVALTTETKGTDLVLLLKDPDLRELIGTIRVDGEITAEELGRFEISQGQNSPLIIVAEDEDLSDIPSSMRGVLNVQRVIKVGIEDYYLLTTAVVPHGAARVRRL
jgi:hypothetical protein